MIAVRQGIARLSTRSCIIVTQTLAFACARYHTHNFKLEHASHALAHCELSNNISFAFIVFVF
jgi:hypothetical protein